MSGPLQVAPAGLLGFLQLKNAGSNPRELVDSVQPTFDLFRRYLETMANQWTTASGVAVIGNAAGGAVFSPNAIVVPATEWWYVSSYGVSLSTLTAGDVLDYSPALKLNQAGTIHWELCRNQTPRLPMVAATPYAPHVAAFDFFAPPGAEFGFWIHGATLAASETFSAELRYTRMPI